MKLVNTTSMNDRDIESIASWVGLDISEAFTLYVVIDSDMQECGQHLGHVMECGNNFHMIKLKKDGDTRTLAHELRHVYQGQSLGLDVMGMLYAMEQAEVGYQDNAFEVDARQWEGEAA
jgi:hypothetical protein